MQDHNFFYKLSVLVLCLAMALILYFFYMLFRPYNIIAVDYVKAVEPAYVGEHIRLEQSYCKYMDTPGVVSTLLSNGVNIPIAQFTGSLDTGCHNFTFDLPLPDYILEGEYRFHFIARYQPNPIRTIDVVFDSEPFYVAIKE